MARRRFCATKGFDLLMMGHHPKSRILAFLKDTTDELVTDRIDCPIMLVPLTQPEHFMTFFQKVAKFRG